VTVPFLCYTLPSSILLACKVNNTCHPQTQREQKFTAGYQHSTGFTSSTQYKHQPTPSSRHKLYMPFYIVSYHGLFPPQSQPVKLWKASLSPMAPRSCSWGPHQSSQSKAQTCKQWAMNGLGVEWQHGSGHSKAGQVLEILTCQANTEPGIFF